MKLVSIFQKPVNRQIEGVIKADDQENLVNEVEEYVLTKEIEKRLEQFLEAYNSYSGANGVWISGFFGSGKSHLLKMMSLLLGNANLEGFSVTDTFLEKCAENKILTGSLNKAATFPAKSILFNIDQKADVISKTEVDALLSVFVKVFDESCGYYGKQGYIAEFERALDEDDLLSTFQAEILKSETRGWDWVRMRAHRYQSQIDQAYTLVTGQKADAIMDRYKSDYKVSIEDFADKVHAYIKKQPAKNFRLNFFVDEVGQYIADNTKLMTNLQTIAESLATKCRGQSWILVTAQEDMNKIVGDLGKHRSNDFTKIQARFANAMPLTSKDVSEVIQKRLLAKTDDGETKLGHLYDHQVNNFKTLFGFSDGSVQYRLYNDKEHFVNCYPFVPYQFDLFQSAIRNLSERNAFTGKHSSVGERSMLGVFQDVAKQLVEQNVGDLATFDMMFEGLRSALTSQIQSSILNAERNLDNPLAIRLLKALFLVKYVREFKPTLQNLCILMLDGFEVKQSDLSKKVQEALNVLENQVYIQRNGEHYEFLTDEEKDVEQEIVNTEVDPNDIAEEMATIIFDHVLRTKKLRFDPAKQDFPFTRKLDDRVYGRPTELAVHVISPFHDEYAQLDKIKLRMMGQPELLLILPADDRIFRDIRIYKQTEKYTRQNISVAQQESVKRILTEKTLGNRERHAKLTDQLKDSLSRASMFVGNNEIESASQDPNSRVHAGFEELVKYVYTNLPMLRGIQYAEDHIEKCLRGDYGLFPGDATSMSEAETEMLSHINRKTQTGLRVTIKTLVEDFEKRPFGWSLPAIMCILAKLCGRGKIEARSDGQPLEENKLVLELKNTRTHGNIILEPQIEFTPAQLRRVKDFYQQFFDRSPHGTDAKSLGEEIAHELAELGGELKAIEAKSVAFPFLTTLSEPVLKLNQLSKKSYKYFLTEFEAESDALLDLKEDVIDPLRRFVSGPHAVLYREAREFIASNETNFAYIDGDEPGRLKQILDDPKCYVGNSLQQARTLLDSLKVKVEQKLLQVRENSEYEICERSKRLQTLQGFDALDSSKMDEIQASIQDAKKKVREHSSIAFIKDATRLFDEEQYPRLLTRVTQLVNEKAHRGEKKADETNPVDRSGIPDPVEYVPIRSVRVDIAKAFLETEQDVEVYLEALRAGMLRVINAKKRIQF